MSRSRLVCIDCDGKGKLTGVFPVYAEGHSGPPAVDIVCPRCKGLKEMPPDMPLWIEEGGNLKHWRQNHLSIGLREAAEMVDMKPSEYSAIEEGLVRNGWAVADIQWQLSARFER